MVRRQRGMAVDNQRVGVLSCKTMLLNYTILSDVLTIDAQKAEQRGSGKWRKTGSSVRTRKAST